VVRRIAGVVLALSAVACGGPVEETLVPELRVLAAIPDVPEAAPGEGLGVQVTAIDPDDAGYDALVWLCTPTGPPGAPCLEATSGTTDGWTARVDETGRAEGLTVPAALAGVLSDEVPEVQTTVWVLTCAPGLCPLIDRAAAATDADSGWDQLVTDLSDPAAHARELPLEGVALTRRSLVVSMRSEDARNQHPRFTRTPDAVQRVAVGGEVTLDFDVEDDETVDVYGYTTLGGFDASFVTVSDLGYADPTWIVGEDAESGQRAELVVIASDGRGGEVLWRGSGEVE